MEFKPSDDPNSPLHPDNLAKLVTQPPGTEFTPTTPLSPQAPDTPPSDITQSPHVQTELQKYAEAVRQEFAKSEQDRQEQLNKQTLTGEFFKGHVATAAAQLVWLSQNADSEAVRAACSKFIVNEANREATADGDPIRDLLKELKVAPPTKTITE